MAQYINRCQVFSNRSILFVVIYHEISVSSIFRCDLLVLRGNFYKYIWTNYSDQTAGQSPQKVVKGIRIKIPLIQLARPIPPRHAPRANPIIAGPKPMPTKSFGNSSNQSQGATPLKFDPWANYSGTRPAPATPSNPGPTDLKFEAQEQRIEKLETSLKEMQVAQEESKHQLTDLKTEVQTRDTATRNHFDSQLQQMQQQLNHSFSQALNTQTKSFDQGMQELKAMLMQSKRKMPEKDGSDMEP